MKIANSEIKHIGQTILIWTIVNLIFNLLGLYLTKLLNEAAYTHMENIQNEFFKPLTIQSFLFSICLIVAYLFLKNRKLTLYLYVLLQFIIFHFIFFLNLKINPSFHFESSFNNLGLLYLSYCGQYLVDILYLYFPINGYFENGAFMPSNIATFYIHWILLNLLYYFAITWISIYVVKLLFKSKN